MGDSYKWPNLSDVISYRQEVHTVVQEVIDSASLELPITVDNPLVSGLLNLFAHTYSSWINSWG